jgi:hypothetical protein
MVLDGNNKLGLEDEDEEEEEDRINNEYVQQDEDEEVIVVSNIDINCDVESIFNLIRTVLCSFMLFNVVLVRTHVLCTDFDTHPLLMVDVSCVLYVVWSTSILHHWPAILPSYHLIQHYITTLLHY